MNAHAVVVEQPPATPDGQPFPTAYWLCCPGLIRAVSVLEGEGGVRALEDEIARLIRKHFDLRPGAIIDTLQLRRPIYRQTAAYGHFGRNDLDLPWERLDKVAALKADAGLA